MSTFNGIDVSYYQGNINFNQVAKTKNFAILRAGYGKYSSQKDAKFDTYYDNATAAGLNVGAYWFSYATDKYGAKNEAAVCLSIIRNKKFSYPIYYDLEYAPAFKSGRINEIASTFLNELESHGYFAGIYISRSPAQAYLSKDTRNRYALWLAEYNSKLNYFGQYGIWQKSSTGKVKGINGYVDLDISYIDYPSIITKKHFNNY